MTEGIFIGLGIAAALLLIAIIAFPFHHDAVCAGFDVLRILTGQEPKNYSAEDLSRLFALFAEARKRRLAQPTKGEKA